MKSFGEDSHIRKMPLNCGNQEIKKLLLRVLERTLLDLTETKLALSPNMVNKDRKSSLKKQALWFLRTEWCKDMCEYTGIDYTALITHAQKIMLEASQKSGDDS